MGVATLGRFHQLVDDVRRRGLVGITHAEINDVLTRRPSLLLELADNIEHVRREARNALELIIHGSHNPIARPLVWRLQKRGKQY